MRGRHDHAIAETAPGHATTMSGRFPVHTGHREQLAGREHLGIAAHRFERRRGRVTVPFPRHDALRLDGGGGCADSRPLGLAQGSRGDPARSGARRSTSTGMRCRGCSRPRATTATRCRAGCAPSMRAPPATQLRGTGVGRRSCLRTAMLSRTRIRLRAMRRDYVFPHTAHDRHGPPVGGAIRDYPWMDSLTIAFALEGQRALGLGMEAGRTDLLAVSLSSDGCGGPPVRAGLEGDPRSDPPARSLPRGVPRRARGARRARSHRRRAHRGPRRRARFPSGVPRTTTTMMRSAWTRGTRGVPRMRRCARRASIRRPWRMTTASACATLTPFTACATWTPDAIAAVWVRALRPLNGVFARRSAARPRERRTPCTDDIARRWLHMLPVDGPCARW
jgi:hypothetical protein